MTRGEVEELRVPDSLVPGGRITVLQWHVHEGESFQPRQPLVDLISVERMETLSATVPGRVVEVLVDEGATVQPGEAVARLLVEGAE